jgi:methoxymalonate biosynthesis acyl carrier protein
LYRDQQSIFRHFACRTTGQTKPEIVAMDQLNTERIVAEFLAKATGLASLGTNDDLLALGVIDSLTMMDLLVFIETRFGVRIDFQHLNAATFESVSRIAALIVEYQSGRTPINQAA